jgi:hypothetical protein
MSNHGQKVEELKAWLLDATGAESIEHFDLFDRSVTVLRARMPKPGKNLEIEVSEEALDDHPVDVILEDWRAQNVPARLLSDPTMRLKYYTDRIVPHFETLGVICSGRRYRVVRDSAHNVRVYDSDDRPLERLPQQLLVLTGSIHRQGSQEWCIRIHEWRGASQ